MSCVYILVTFQQMFESLGLKCHFSVRIPTKNDSGSTFSNGRFRTVKIDRNKIKLLALKVGPNTFRRHDVEKRFRLSMAAKTMAVCGACFAGEPIN